MESIFWPLIDNGMKLVRSCYSKSMFQLGISGVLNGSRIVFESFSHPDPCATMNLAAESFLDSGCDRMVVIDSDHDFQPADIARLLSHDLPLVSGLYSKKTVDLEWPVMPIGDESPEVLFADDAPSPVEVRCVPRGFISIHKSVFETLMPHVEVDQGLHFFFRSLPGIASEDFTFCDLYRKHGGKVWLDHKIRVFHEGSCMYPIKK